MIAIRTSRHFLFGLTMLVSLSVAGQQAERTVIGSAGGNFKTAKAELEWTLGEVMTESYDIGQISLSQGFHQPESVPTGIFSVEAGKAGFHVYPNPVAQSLYLKREDASQNLSVRLLDASGKLCRQVSWESNFNELTIDFSQLAAGIYVLHLTDESQLKTYQYRIAKIVTQ